MVIVIVKARAKIFGERIFNIQRSMNVKGSVLINDINNAKIICNKFKDNLFLIFLFLAGSIV